MAVNEAGVGAASETTGVVTARDLVTKPGPPAALTAELGPAGGGGATAQLRWKKPLSDGQSPVVNYVVEMRSSKAPRWKVGSPACTALSYRCREFLLGSFADLNGF